MEQYAQDCFAAGPQDYRCVGCAIVPMQEACYQMLNTAIRPLVVVGGDALFLQG